VPVPSYWRRKTTFQEPAKKPELGGGEDHEDVINCLVLVVLFVVIEGKTLGGSASDHT
jgi:hypothetical protein